MIEKITVKILSQCFFMKALRTATGNAIRLGMMDAVENPNAPMMDLPQTGNPAGEEEKPSMEGAVPVSLPRPQLIGVAPKKVEEEPDRPGVPPRRVRRKRMNETPEAPEEKAPASEPKQEGDVR